MLRKLDEPIKFYLDLFEEQRDFAEEDSGEQIVASILLDAFIKRRIWNQDRVDEYSKPEKVTDSDYTDSEHIIYTIALDVWTRGQFSHALNLFNDVYSSWRSKLGRTHIQTINTKFNIGQILKRQKKYEEALDCFKEVYDVRSRKLGAAHIDTLNSKDQIGAIYWHQSEYELAYQTYSEIADVLSSYKESLHYRSLKARFWMARILMKQGAYQESLDLFSEIYLLYRNKFGEDFEETLIIKYYVELLHESIENQKGCFQRLKEHFRKLQL